ALEYPELSSRELAFKITDEQGIYLSESSVYRILKQRGLIAAPNHILITASNEFKDKTQFVHQMWQTDFTYFKIEIPPAKNKTPIIIGPIIDFGFDNLVARKAPTKVPKACAKKGKIKCLGSKRGIPAAKPSVV